MSEIRDVEVTAGDQRDHPESLRWTDTRRGEEFVLITLNVRLLPDGHLAAKAYGRPVAGGGRSGQPGAQGGAGRWPLVDEDRVNC